MYSHMTSQCAEKVVTDAMKTVDHELLKSLFVCF